MRFTLHIGIDYSGAQTPESRLKGLQVYKAKAGHPPRKISTPTEGAKNWTRLEVAHFCAAAIETGEPVIIGIELAQKIHKRQFAIPIPWQSNPVVIWRHVMAA